MVYGVFFTFYELCNQVLVTTVTEPNVQKAKTELPKL